MTNLVDDLKDIIAKRQVVAVIGAGVSIGATNGAVVASWTGLLNDGVERVEQVAQPLPAGWADRARGEIASGDMDELLSAAEKISSKLGAPGGGEYRRWLRETVGQLKVVSPDVIKALQNLGVPLATTNYDSLIEQVTGWPAVTWMDGAKIERVLRGNDQGVLHLHGYWDRPESVVLGIRSYEKALAAAHLQTMMKAMRALSSFLFVGCGEGLADPNFGALLRWSRELFPDSEYRQYRLARNVEVDAVQKQHPPAERVFVIGFGPKHSDLAPFLRALKAPGVAKAAATKPAIAWARLPGLGRCLGREPIVEDIVTTLLRGNPPPTPVLGCPGIGKSTVTLAALHDKRVAERFGARRWFVRCDGANSAETTVGEVAKTMGLTGAPDVVARVFAELESAPAALALDNAETPYETDPTGFENLLKNLAGIPQLALVVAMRGNQRPLGPAWRGTVTVTPLSLDASRRVFVAVAGDKFAKDGHLDELLRPLDGVPLAIELMAVQAEQAANLNEVLTRWQAERTRMLQRLGSDQRVANLEVSFELSIQSPRMTDEARRLASLLGVLPAGIAHIDLDALLPGVAVAAAATLRANGLAYDEADRLRCLAPIREYVARAHPPAHADEQRCIDHYLRLAEEKGPLAGRPGGAEAIAGLAPEWANVAAMIERGLKATDPVSAIVGAIALRDFVSFTGLGEASPIAAARDAARRAGDAWREAEALYAMGLVASDRSDHEKARAQYEAALPLYQKVGDVTGEASCISSLGDIALYRSDHDAARAQYEAALPLFRRGGQVLGEAACLARIAEIALRCSDHERAQAQYEAALPLFRRVGDVLGEANCIKRLGDIALRRSNHDAARGQYEAALPLYRRVGSVLGEANCIHGLGDIARERSDHLEARAQYEAALPLYRRVGHVLGEANCIQSLGDIANTEGDQGAARQSWDDALRLYERIKEPYSIGLAHQRLARIATGKKEKVAHVRAARQAWESIKRPDLVKELEDEFGKLGKG